jgi:hypothetical protein
MYGMRPISVLGVSVPILVADDEDEPDLEGNDGVYLTEEGRIVIDSELCQALRWHVLRHEIMHAAMSMTNFKHDLVTTYGLSEAYASAIEELVCRVAVPTFCGALEQAGWLKPPTVR